MNMDINNFTAEVKAEVSRKLGYEYEVYTIDVPRNNGLMLHGLNILNRQVNLSPCIYLEPYHERFEYGSMSLDAVVDDIIKVYEENKIDKDWDTSSFTDYTRAREKLQGRLINTEKNKELLKTVPHREFLDLSLIYTVNYICEHGRSMGSIRVTNEHMKMWKVDEDELFRQTKENMERKDESFLKNLRELLEEMRGKDELPPDADDMVSMYILSNKTRNHGAVQMMNKDMLRETAEKFGKDLIILPSSIHEVLLIPAKDDEMNADELRQTVREVNDTQLALNEILSYHVYRYSQETGEISIAA
jgi:hypothetical protein